ncbi:lantibiotic dehydratase [Streptomyces olivochromogenes]|uniref:lantibiotic dehydratase n=1 Tax=Streptomyces olivochromogenes TaxID=1963 RepID=UPI0036DD7CE6
MTTPLFEYGKIALLRAPLHRWDGTAADPQTHAGDDPYPVGSLREFLLQSRDALLDEAIEVSSPALAGTLRRAAAGTRMKPGDIRRAALSLTKYQLRGSSRATPFGLWAGVGRVDFGSTTKVVMGPHHSRVTGPDLGQLIGLVRQLEHLPQVVARLRIQKNNLAVLRGDRLVVFPTDTNNPEVTVQQTVRATPVVRLILDLTTDPVPFAKVLAAVQARFPTAPREAISGLLNELIQRDMLVTDLRPPAEHPDPLAHVMSLAPEAAELTALATAFPDREFSPSHANGSAPASPARDAALVKNGAGAGYSPAIDVVLDVQGSINTAVAEELAAAAEVLWRVAPRSSGSTSLAGYHSRFVDRYGHHQAVPVMDLLDPERGIGAPEGYRLPSSEAAAEPRRLTDTRRDAFLAELALPAIRAGEELVLDDDTVAALAAILDDGAAAPDLPPRGLDIYAELLAEDSAAVDQGRFEVVLSPWPGGHTPGATFGRFAHLLGGTDLMAEVAARPQAGALPAHLSYRPRLAKMRNVARSPHWLPHRVVVGALHGDRPGDIPLADLAVIADRTTLRLFSVSRGAEVDVHAYTMVNAEELATNPARFLQEISVAGRRHWKPWTWGSLSALPALPPVRYGRVLLAPAGWRCSDPELLDPALPWPLWQKALSRWREEWSVPDLVLAQAGGGDQRIRLDLSREWHRYLLRAEITADTSRPMTLVEDRAELIRARRGSATGWLGKDIIGTELVAALKAKQPPPSSPPAFPGVVRAPAAHLPGSSWLYGKIYSAQHDLLLAAELKALVSSLPPGVTDWFFLRYRDPDPHIRLRFHGDPDLLSGPVLHRLRTWADSAVEKGLARRLELASYEPEYERYGGQTLTPLAHAVFHTDSAYVLDLLAPPKRATWQSAVASSYELVHDILAETPVDPWEWMLRATPKDEKYHKAFRAERQGILETVSTYLAADLTRGTDGATARVRRTEALRAYGSALYEAVGPDRTGAWDRVDEAVHSMLHMHHNRLLGINQETELKMLAACRGIAQLHEGRRHSGH